MQLTPEQLDALKELLNIGVGRAAGSLNEMLEKPIRLHIPSIRIGPIEDLRQEIKSDIPGLQASVQLPFRGSFSGSTSFEAVAGIINLTVTPISGEITVRYFRTALK